MKETSMLLARKAIGKDTEVLFMQQGKEFVVSICITKLQKPYYCNQLYKYFDLKEQAEHFFELVTTMTEQGEI